MKELIAGFGVESGTDKFFTCEDLRMEMNEQNRESTRKRIRTSIATRWTLAWPCLPVLEVDMSTILHGRPTLMAH